MQAKCYELEKSTKSPLTVAFVISEVGSEFATQLLTVYGLEVPEENKAANNWSRITDIPSAYRLSPTVGSKQKTMLVQERG